MAGKSGCPYCRFFSKIKEQDGHWIWTAKKFNHGYGIICHQGKPIQAHRFAWMFLCGPIGYRQHIYNLCGKRDCVRPQHWAEGTPKDYVYDWRAQWRKRGKLVKKSIWYALAPLFLAVHVQAYTVVTVSTGVPPTVEKALLAQTTTQFNASLIVNPLAANTYQVKLFGFNPAYQPPPPAPALINLDTLTTKLTAISTYTYVLGFASGMLYERNSDAAILGFYMNLCSSATTFNLVKIDSTTCQGVLGFMDNWIIRQSSGLAVVPNPPPGF